jgi:predicted outer membrane protein
MRVKHTLEGNMKRSHLMFGAAAAGSLVLSGSMAIAQETQAPFCKSDYTDKLTPAQSAICADPSGVAQMHIVTVINLMTDENVSDDLRDQLNDRQTQFYDNIDKNCKNDIRCIGDYAAKYQNTMQSFILKSIASAQKPGDDLKPDDSAAQSSDSSDMNMSGGGDTAGFDPSEFGSRAENLSKTEDRLLILLNTVDEGAITIAGIALANGPADPGVRDMASTMIRDHNNIKLAIVRGFSVKDVGRFQLNDNYAAHIKQTMAALRSLKGMDAEKRFVVGEFKFHKGLVSDIDSNFKPDNVSPAVAKMIARVKATFEHHEKMALDNATIRGWSVD